MTHTMRFQFGFTTLPLVLYVLFVPSFLHAAGLALGDSPDRRIQQAGISGGLVVQLGSDDLSLKTLGQRFHVRLLLTDAAAVDRTQAAIDKAGLAGRFTVDVFDGKRLPLAERVVNALVLAQDGLISEQEALRVLAPRGLLIGPSGVRVNPVPPSIDEWTHYLYDASGNAVSKDREVAPLRSFRWHAAPLHLRSHNHSASFLGLVTAHGRMFHVLDEGSSLFDKGGLTEQWSVVARDAFNGALLWKRPLAGYGQTYFENVSGQPVPDYVWRSPLSINRRLVAQGDKVYAALSYREGPLSILDAASGKTLREVDLGGSVDEIVADGDLVICRVRTEIPMPETSRTATGKRAAKANGEDTSLENARAEFNARLLDQLMQAKIERITAVEAATGAVRWRHDAPLAAHQSLAMVGGKVVFHNYQSLVALDAQTGTPAWTFPCPVTQRQRFGSRSLLGNLLLADGKVLWTSGATGGAVCLDQADGRLLWQNPRMGQTGGFGFPTALRRSTA